MDKIDQFLLPFENFNEFIVFFYLYFEYNNENMVKKFFGDIFKKTINVKLIADKFFSIFKLSSNEKNNTIPSTLNQLKFIIRKEKINFPPITKCIVCSKFLIFHKSNSKHLFALNGCKIQDFVSHICNLCNIIYNVSTFKKNGILYSYNSEIPIQFHETSKETVFDVDLLKNFDSHIVRNGVTFEGKSKLINNILEFH
jgi:hypothetical protein